jgi:RNA polymerase sigma factor (sigma-70 family)
MATVQLGAILPHLRALAADTTAHEETDGTLLRIFVDRNDQSAFETLLRRHGPMVLRVCRRTLGHVHDAEDALQATFLVLARQANAIRKQESLASWLHGVAYRMATNAKRTAERRRQRESRVNPTQPRDPGLCAAWQELQKLLDEEIAGLPETLRSAFVLCCLENKSAAEAGRALGLKETTAAMRVSRARKLLQERLTQRGVSLTAVLAAAAVGLQDGSAAAFRSLLACTARAATRMAAGEAGAEGLVSPNVATLTEGVLRTMFPTRLLTAAATLVSLGIICASLLVLRPALGQQRATGALPPAAQPATAPGPETPEGSPKAVPGTEAAPTVVITGRVLGAEDKPVGSARVYLWSKAAPRGDAARVRAETAADGRFRFLASKAESEGGAVVIATAPGYGPEWADPSKGAPDGGLTLRLPKDDLPVSGRVLNSEGQPVAGATIELVQVGKRAGDGDLPSLIERNLSFFASGADASMVLAREVSFLDSGVAGLPTSLVTGKDGRFRLAGLGLGRIVVFDISGPGIARQRTSALTLPQLPRGLPEGLSTLHPANFDHLASPSRPIAGVVTDKETGKPIAGARVMGRVSDLKFASGAVDAISDAQGRYKVDWLPKNPQYVLTVVPPAGSSYLPQQRTLADPEGLGLVTADLPLPRGSVVEGRLLDRETGKPVSGQVRYLPLPGNEYEDPIRGEQGELGWLLRAPQQVGKDGSFKLIVAPGPGVIWASGEAGQYLRAPVSPEDAKKGVLNSILFKRNGVLGYDHADGSAYQLIEPGGKPEALTVDLEFWRGRTLTGTTRGPDGKPVAGAVMAELTDRINGFFQEVRFGAAGADGAFTLTGVDPRRTYQLVISQPKDGLAARVQVAGDTKGPLTVRLEPCGQVTGRLLGADGKPLAGARIQIRYSGDDGRLLSLRNPPPVQTKPISVDAEGRFLAEGFAPGIRFELLIFPAVPGARKGAVVRSQQAHFIKDLSCKAGEKKDLGDVKVTPPPE